MAASVDIQINAQDNASSVFGGLTVTLGDVMNIAGKVAGAVTDFFGSTIKAAEEQQDVSAQLEAGLKSTGGAAGVTMQQMTDLAEAQAKVTDFSKVQTEAIEKVALTFTSVNKDIFPQTISLSEDMAQRLGIQGTQAMTMIGKAMDDPIKGMGALHRVGVSFTDQQKDQIKALVAAGDTMGAQKILLGELSKEYGGSATAAGATFAGQQAILAHQFDAVKEKIGTALLPVLGQLTGVITTNVLPVVQQFAEWFTTHLPDAMTKVQSVIAPLGVFLKRLAADWTDAGDATSSFAEQLGFTLDTLIGTGEDIQGPFQTAVLLVQQLFHDAGDSSTALGGVIADLQNDWQMLQPVITNVVNAVQSVVLAVFGVIQTFLKAHGTEISATMQDAWTRIQAIIKTGIELYNAIVPPVLNAIAGFIKAHGAEIQAILSATWDAIKAVIDVALTLIQGVITIALDIIHGDWSKAWEDIKTMSARIVTDLIAIIKADLEVLKTVFGDAIKWINDEWAKLPAQLESIGAAIVHGIQAGVSSAWSSFTSWIHDKIMELPQAVRDALNIHSPSQVFADQVGEPIITGITQGILNGASGLTDALNGILSSALAAAQAAVASFNDLSGLGINMNADTVAGAFGGGSTKIPGFASGVRNFGGGVAMVGEKGPELVNLPRGSSVTPNDASGINVTIQFADGMGWLKDFVTTTVNGAAYKGNFRVRTGG